VKQNVRSMQVEKSKWDSFATGHEWWEQKQRANDPGAESKKLHTAHQLKRYWMTTESIGIAPDGMASQGLGLAG
jgi:hypothetical protein